MKPFIGIKRLWYGEPLTTEPSVKNILTTVATMTEVKNVHNGTWGYTQDDPSTTDYVNELTGITYYRDKETDGAHTIAFTLGVYDFKDKAELQGGDVVTDASETVGWKSKAGADLISKCIVAQTKTGNYIIFTNAAIVAKADTQDKNIGLGVSAVAMESDTEGVSAIYFFDGAKISA